MEMVFAVGISILSLALVVLITLQPHSFDQPADATSNLENQVTKRSTNELLTTQQLATMSYFFM